MRCVSRIDSPKRAKGDGGPQRVFDGEAASPLFVSPLCAPQGGRKLSRYLPHNSLAEPVRHGGFQLLIEILGHRAVPTGS